MCTFLKFKTHLNFSTGKMCKMCVFFLLLFIYLNCKWVFTWWQCTTIRHNTHHTNNMIHSKILAQRVNAIAEAKLLETQTRFRKSGSCIKQQRKEQNTIWKCIYYFFLWRRDQVVYPNKKIKVIGLYKYVHFTCNISV
jgi:hypothetical protein